GTPVAWDFPGARLVDLPTYPFQHKHFWLNPGPVGGDADAFGQLTADHPLLGATLPLPDGGVVATGRLSLHSHPWLADHVVMGTVILPATAYIDLALHVGGGAELAELTLAAPLVLPEQGAVAVRLFLGPPDEDGRRALRLDSRPAEGDDDWTAHASGFLAAGTGEPAQVLNEWPPSGAEPVSLDGLYDRIADSGLTYGPAFRGVRKAWRGTNEIFAEVALPDHVRADAPRFGLHPALLDAALHPAVGIPGLLADAADAGLPFSWTGVRLHRAGVDTLRVRLAATGTRGLTVEVTDTDGNPVAKADSLVSRPLSPELITAAKSDALFTVDWVPVQATPPPRHRVALATTDDDPAQAFADLGSFADLQSLLAEMDDDLPAPSAVFTSLPGNDPHTVAEQALHLVQHWLADPRLTGAQLVFVTTGAVATTTEDVPGLAHSTVWGLVRAAQSENPGRFVLLDTDGSAPILTADEPQLAIRGTQLLAPRLAKTQVPGTKRLEGPVLITGGTG
ncbi:MAG TPA: polyketide synthase dehydratase domain-containing protein, partial [Streptomyces sp.]